MVYFNPGGHNWAPGMNLDGFGISEIVFAVVYSIFFYAACAFVWVHRNHPVIKMRNISLALISILVLHVYLFIVLMVYPMNGTFPCGVEFWVMSIYLPIGIGLFQAQNQQLLLVSRAQSRLLLAEEHYKPLYKRQGKGIGGPKYWIWRLKLWWQATSTQGRCECFVLVGVFVQFSVSLIVYCISRRFNGYGIIARPTTQGQCRRGWEWAPSIVWQFLWNFLFGPYLLWKIRLIRDIYNWRLQTTLAIVAGLPGTPLWVAATFSERLTSFSKYWVAPMWFLPGLIVIQWTTLIFPIMQIFKHKKAVRETQQALADFDMKKLISSSTSSGSLVTGSTNPAGGKMHSMESLDDCLGSNYDALQVYASFQELNGENIRFLVKVLNFQKQWHAVLANSKEFSPAILAMFRMGLDIYVTLIDADTAHYPINIEHPIYAKLEALFGTATALVATRRNDTISVMTSPHSVVTPWDEPQNNGCGFPMSAMPCSRPGSSSANESSEHIMSLVDPTDPNDPLANFIVPDAFDEHVFDAAFKSIKYMVWSETWQRFCSWKRSSNGV